MGQLKYLGDLAETIYAAELNNMAYANKNGVLASCEVTESVVPAMTVDVASGRVFFGVDSVDYAGTTGLVVAANSSGFDRIDLVMINTVGVASIITGTGSALPASPDYDPELFVVLALITVPNAAALILDVNIKDIRIENIGGGGSGGGTFARHIETFTAQTVVNVVHNLGDDEPNVFIYDGSDTIIANADVTSIVSNSVNDVTVTFTGSTTGKIIVYGGSGVNNAYFSQSFSAVSSVSVSHNLSNQNVLVQVVDSTGDTIIPTSVVRTDANTVDVTFGGNETGTVIIAGGVSSIGLPQSPSQGDIIYHDGNAWVALGAGTLGQLLQTNGAGADPTWETPVDVTFRLLGVDTTGGTTSSGTVIKIGEVAIGAGIATSYVVITAPYELDLAAIGDTATLQVYAGETGSEVSKHTFDFQESSSANNGGVKHAGTISYYYAPTTDEKTNGFNMQIYGTNSGTGSTICVQLLVMGV